MMKATSLFAMVGIASFGLTSGGAFAESPYQSSSDFAKYAMKLRESSIMSLEPHVIVPTTSKPFGLGSQYPWKRNIVTTVFWVGEAASARNPVHNRSSSWDLNWSTSFGGYDNPEPYLAAQKLHPRRLHPTAESVLLCPPLQRRHARYHQARGCRQESSHGSSKPSSGKGKASARIAGSRSEIPPTTSTASPSGATAAPFGPIITATSLATKSRSQT